MTLAYHGRSAALSQLRDRAHPGRDGTSAYALIELARPFGLVGRAIAVSPEHRPFLERGTILHWGFNHFVVFDGFSRGGARIVDPRHGRTRVDDAEFSRLFTGVAITFEALPQHDSERHSAVGWWVHARHTLTAFSHIRHILIASLLLHAVGLGIPLLSRTVIDRVVPTADTHLLWLVAAVGVILILFQSVATWVRSSLMLYLRTRLDTQMMLGFVDHLLSLPLSFFQARRTGDLLVRLNSNSVVRDILAGTVLASLLDGSLAVGYMVALLLISPSVAIVAFSSAVLQVSLLAVTRLRQRRLASRALELQAKTQGHAFETLSAIEIVKAMGVETSILTHWSTLFSAELNVTLQRGAFDALFDACGSLLRQLTALVILSVTAMAVIRHQLTLGDMMALSALANGFIAPLVSLASAGARLPMLTVYLERLDDVFRTPPEMGPSGQRPTRAVLGAIATERLCFRYGEESPYVVDDVSFAIGPGQCIAIVGRSGSGKSTLARLLLGLYPPSRGRVLYDGLPLSHFDLQELRGQIGFVTQHIQLFSGSIRSNIALGAPDATLDRIADAARLACIHDDICAMAMGYETSLVDRGLSLSGGQLQRIALARALLRRPRILVLDEATNQLDGPTEEAVVRQLTSLQCTRIVIAHRLNTVIRADCLLVMDSGRLVESGSHLELLARGAQYASLVRAQLSGVLE